MKEKTSLRMRAAFAALCLLFTKNVCGAELDAYFIADSFTYSETVSIHSALNDWEGKGFDRGERQWSWNWLELGITWRGISLGYVIREDYDIRFSEDLSELYWLTSNKQSLPENRSYEIDLSANHFQAEGVRLSFSDDYAIGENTRLTFGVGVAFYRADDLISGYIEGDATTIDENDYQYNANLYYHYSQDVLFERQVMEPQGEGCSFDFTLGVSHEKHDFFVNVKDFKGRLYWQQAPYTVGVIDSDKKEYDENGYVIINPTLSGFEGIDDEYVQELEPRILAHYSLSVSEQWSALLLYRSEFDQDTMGAGISWGSEHRLQLSYWAEISLWQLGWQYRKISLSVGTDSISKNAKSLLLTASYNAF